MADPYFAPGRCLPKYRVVNKKNPKNNQQSESLDFY